MENGHLHDDKLFRAVNERLSNYEAPYEGANWDAMSRSLDQLPKATRFTFKWKVSLNSILIAVGILSISILGYALTGSNHGKNTNTAAANIPVVQVKNDKPATPVQNISFTMPTTNVVQNDASVLNNSTTVMNGNAMAANMNNAAQGSFHRRKPDDNTNGFYFGDMIDRRKGFIYHTQENSTLVSSHTDSVPSTYYDIVDGHERTIHLKKDSTPINKTTFNADSTSSNGTPAGEDRQGFDFQGN
ncbi:MAG TPA: hypothetical protein VL651_06130 [Bacteroidia bacterium]|jgi:hypothetical protein|nr:hypothetical protein [Bacteroidia bacterium]